MPSTARPFLAILGLSTPGLPDAAAVEARLAQLDPSRTYDVRLIPIGKDTSATGLLIEAEGVQFTVVPRPGDFDAAPYRSAITAAALHWRDASAAVARTTGQIVVAANQPAGDHAAAVKVAFLLTVVAEAIAGLCDPTFVYWGTADLLVDPRAFATAASAMLAKNEPPILQWVRFDLFRGPDSPSGVTGGLRSNGLAPFLGFELQLDPLAMPPVEIARRAVGYAEHLLREGPNVVREEVEGPDDGERIALALEKASHGTVLRMRIADTGPRKSS